MTVLYTFSSKLSFYDSNLFNVLLVDSPESTSGKPLKSSIAKKKYEERVSESAINI